jgi:hypothetical protein
MIATIRVRLNVRLPDAEGKYRDEMTQEAEISLDEQPGASLEELTERAQSKVQELRNGFYREACRLGAADYQEKP